MVPGVNSFTQSRNWERSILTLIFLMLVLSLYIYAIHSEKLFWPILKLAELRPWQKSIIRPSLLWGFIGLLLLCFRTLLWYRYRPYPSARMHDAPFLTVIIPAYNEGEMVGKSINSVMESGYPAGRLEIFVVDDGSKDDTWDHISRAAERHPDLITAVRFARNQGKRAALAEGFLKAQGEVVITIDSDSVIDKGTLLSMVGPFADPKVGAVAGRVKVFNTAEGLIPKMLHVRFALSFDFLRAAQSSYGTVYCCPGALAAYRISVVRKVMKDWMSQTFLGADCTIGEDRSMTNFILKENYDSVYQRTAVVHTIVPVTYEKLCKMFLRWDRSYIREEFRLAAISLSRPLFARLVTIADITVTNVAYLFGYLSLIILASFCFQDHTILTRILIAIGLTAGLNTLYYLKAERSWDFVFGIFYAYYSFFTMFWILPYAALTVRSKSWLTR
jgi:hyaluronan synthase